MLNLILNELLKITHKISFYIIIIIMFLFVILTNVIYKYAYDESGNIKNLINYSYDKEYYQEMLSNATSTYEKIDYEKEIYLIDLKIKYGEYSWQAYYIDSYEFNDLIRNYISSKYNEIEFDKELYDLYIKRFDENDYMSFINEEINDLKLQIDLLKEELKTMESSLEKTNYENELFYLNNNLKALELRKQYDISYDSNYLNDAVNQYLYSLNVKENDNDYDEAIKYRNISEYIITTRQNINKVNDLRGILKNYFEEFGIIIILCIIVLTSSIISEEYNKGTIKQLLISPHKRYKLLLSKILSIFIVLLLSILFIFVLELIIGGIFFGFNSLSIPCVLFNTSTNLIVKYNVFSYLILNFIGLIPMFTIIILFMLLISSLFNNNAITTIFTLILYIAYPLINYFYEIFKVIKYSFTMHFDMTNYIFNTSTLFSFKTSLIVNILYIMVFTFIIFFIFIKKDIKNTD